MARKTERRHEQGDASRTRILEATLALAAERGYDGTSISLVTEATGLPASSIYWHFTNKDELLAETLDYSYRLWRESAPAWSGQLDDGPGDLESRIHRRLRLVAGSLTHSPEFWRLGLMLAVERRLVEPAARRRFLEVRRSTRGGIAEWWQQVLAPAGYVDEEISLRMARLQLSIMDGFYVAERAGRVSDRARLVDLIAAGMYAHVARSLASV